MQDKILNEGKYLIKDLLQGDESVANRNLFKEMDLEDLRESLNLIVNDPHMQDKQKKELIINSWKIHYKVKPPTMEEFLGEKWIGPTADSIYPRSNDILTDYWNPQSQYRNLVLASSIGTGKSFMSTISNLYIVSCLWCMRDIKKFFGLSEATSILLALISFTLDKASQLLLQPFINIITTSEMFRRVKTEERIPIAQRESPDKIVWSTAGRMGQVQFFGDIHLMLASTPEAMLGLNMISGTLSEISHFINKGYSPEYIWKIYNATKDRVESRFGNRYFATTIIDSSPNDIEFSPIDAFIFNGEADRPDASDGVKRNYVVTGPQWEFVPWKYPLWRKSGKTFPVFRGNSGKPAKLLSEEEAKRADPDEVIQVPIDLKTNFINNVTKSVKDFGGYPSGLQDKLIPDFAIIDDMFDFRLKNVYTHIYAPSDQAPEELLWNTIKDDFFIKVQRDHYRFYRAPTAPRFLHIDLSEARDCTGIGICHPEMGEKDGRVYYVFDMTITIKADKRRINLSAIPAFVQDIVRFTGINIAKITYDGYQSAGDIQDLKRLGFDCERLSVDINPNIYYTFISYMANRLIKVGKSIPLKNNLKSLKEIRSEKTGKIKVDHMKGKTDGEDLTTDWEKSYIGRYAKDTSDGACGAFWNCLHSFHGVPHHMWEEIEVSSTKETSDEERKKQYDKMTAQRLHQKIESKYHVALERQ